MASFESRLNHLLGSFDAQMKNDLKLYGLNTLVSLKQVRISWDFLRAAVTFWDSTHHVFRFGDKELCPFVDEWSCILGCFGYSLSALPTLDTRFSGDFMRLLGLSKAQVETFLDDDVVNLSTFRDRFETVPRSSLHRRYFRRAICFLLLNQYLFVGVGNTGNAGLIRMVDQLSDGRSPLHCSLAETILCLDRLSFDPSGAFSGSTLFLQI